MQAYIRQSGVSIQVDVGNMDAAMLHVLWLASVKHGAHVQIAVRMGGKPVFMNIRSLDSVKTFEGMVIPSSTLPPPPP